MSLSIEKIQSVNTIVTHDNCPDGLASAMILQDAYGDLDARDSEDFIFLKPNSPEHRNLKAEPGMLFCDISPPEDRADEFRAAGSIILDHHKTVRDLVASFGENAVFADEALEPGVSGAALAYREIWLPLAYKDGVPPLWCRQHARVQRFAELAGIRDTWQTKNPGWHAACAQAEVLMFYPKAFWFSRDNPDYMYQDVFREGVRGEWERIMALGDLLLKKNEDSGKKTIKGAHRFEVPTRDGKALKVVCFQGTHTSDVAEMLRNEADLVVGWAYFVEPEYGQKLVFSCRSRGNLDISKLAKHFGGGGHTKAAGFARYVNPADPNPYIYLQDLLTEYYALS